MSELKIKFNGKDYNTKYNEQTEYYEIELEAPKTGGIYSVETEFTDILKKSYKEMTNIQILANKKIENKLVKVFMWIFDFNNFLVKDIVEISDYEIKIDEETNANSIIKILKKTTAKDRDIVAIKKNNEIIYWGRVEQINNNNGKKMYEFILKYITNIFNQNVVLKNEDLIKNKGIEDFIAKTITDNFTNNDDNFFNKQYLELEIKTHTKKQIKVSNVENNIYNLHTWLTNCTQNYNIVYSFSVKNKKLIMTIENKETKKELIDTKAQPISNYTEVFETSIVAKVTVLTKEEGEFNLYLLNDRTTTTDPNNKNRADGKVEVVYTEKMEDANQKALDIIKANSYNHNITFNLLDRYIKVGTPIAIKTKNSTILDTYISALNITPKRFIEYTCGNIRIGFLDKLSKERKK